MKGIKHIHRDQQGSILMVVAGLLFITIFLVVSILDVASNSRRISQEQLDMEKAMYVAEGGLERGARFMESNLNVIVSSSTGNTNGSGSIGSGSYTFSIMRSNGNASMYMIVATGTVSTARSGVGIKRVCSLLNVYQPTYAQYALWSHVNGAIWFNSGNVFNGQVHADDQFYFDASNGGPIFHSATTSGAGTYTISGGSIGSIEFDQGLTLNSYQGSMADVDFNSSASTSLKKEAQTSGLYLSGNTTITFNGGTVSISNTHTNPTWSNHSYTLPSKGIIYVANSGTTSGANSGEVFLTGGTVGAALTIASENDMHISGNITYVHDPRTNPSSTDALGLITQDSITVDSTAPTTLEIDAAMMTTGTSGDGDTGSFGVANYNTRTPVGTLTVYGGIVQNQRGAVCTLSGSTTLTGYIKNYSYDNRFLTKPPPYYPTVSNQVSFAQWREGN
jgi:Tfp pilus assembly protein PilX